MTLTRNRPRAATILLVLIIALLMVPLLMLAVTAPARALAPLDDLSVALDLNPEILWAFAVIAGLLALKLILGVATAIRDGTFAWRELPAVLRTNVLPYMIPLAAMAALSVVMPVVRAVYLASAALYLAKLLADIRSAISGFYGLDAPPDVPAPGQIE